MAMKLSMHRCAALALAGGWLLAGSVNAQPTAPGTTSGPASGTPATPTMPATQHQSGVLRGNPTGKAHETRTTAAKPATVHQTQALRNLRNNQSPTAQDPAVDQLNQQSLQAAQQGRTFTPQ
jgi:hypothetical protein